MRDIPDVGFLEDVVRNGIAEDLDCLVGPGQVSTWVGLDRAGLGGQTELGF